MTMDGQAQQRGTHDGSGLGFSRVGWADIKMANKRSGDMTNESRSRLVARDTG